MYVLCMDGGDTVLCRQTLHSSPKGRKVWEPVYSNFGSQNSMSHKQNGCLCIRFNWSKQDNVRVSLGTRPSENDTCTSSPMWMTMGAIGYSKEAVFNVFSVHVDDSDSECQIL